MPIAVGLTVVMFIYASLVMGSQSECVTSRLLENQSLLGLKFGYDLSFVQAIMQQLDEQSLKCYMNLLSIWDSLFPLLYGSMYMAWLSVIYKSVPGALKWPVNLYPIIPALLDWVENFREYKLVMDYLENQSVSPESVELASTFTQIKWSASFLNYGIILIGITILMINKYRSGKTKNN